MKLLIYQWGSYLQYDLFEICRERGVRYDTFSWSFADKNEDEEFIRYFDQAVDGSVYDAVLRVNYWPLISHVCQKQNVKYIAWCYDTPLNVVRIEETLNNSVNNVFLFDRVQYLRYKEKGFDTVYHLPLGVNKTRMEKLSVSDAEYEKYAAQVALVGKLYESQLPGIMAPMDEYTKGYLRALMDAQSRIYGYYLIDDCVTEELIQDINRQYLEKQPNTKVRMSKEALSFAMACEVTRRDRIILLSLSGKRYDTRLYSYQDSEVIQNVKKLPAVDYWEEMPKIFACSKINLNPSLRIIQTGIPLRAFDVMGAGGFLLSNYQEELLELYEEGKEMVVYESMEDAISKIDFYLRHEDLRIEIAKKGRKKTLEENSLQNRLQEIFAIADL